MIFNLSFLHFVGLFKIYFRSHFYQFGEIRTITIVQRQQCAFIQFATRQAAEMAAEKSFNKLIINGRRLTVKWGRWETGRDVVLLLLTIHCDLSVEKDAINADLYGFFFRSQAARGKEGIKDGVSEMGTRLDPVPGLPGGELLVWGRLMSACILTRDLWIQGLCNIATITILRWINKWMNKLFSLCLVCL